MYALPSFGQEMRGQNEWHRTTAEMVEQSGGAPTAQQLADWLASLPEQPDATGGLEALRRRFGRKKAEGSRAYSAAVATRNEAALRNKMHVAGWLDANVESAWHPTRGNKVELALFVTPGERWHIDSISWITIGSGLPRAGVIKHAQLVEGEAFRQDVLEQAQDNIANYAQGQGFYTFNTSHVSFVVDTLNAESSHGLTLQVVCQPWEFSPTTGLSDYGTNEGSLRKHPKVHFGNITWGGESEWESPRPSGVRRSVWEHLNSLSAGAVYSPTPIRLNYNRLSQLRGVESVNLSKTLRWDTSFAEIEVGLPGRATMDVNVQLVPKPSHDIGVELDMVRNDARYGPRLATTLLHRNPRGWGAESAFEFAFGYVAVQPFASLNSEGLLNSGEWTLRHSKHLIGVRPLPLSWFRSSTEPTTWIDVGLDREVWPEFTRTQFHFQYDLGFTENPSRNAEVHFSPANVSFVNLTNRRARFETWLDEQANPLVRTRFNNHLTVGSSLGWESNWTWRRWIGHARVQGAWSGVGTQMLAEKLASSDSFDSLTGAWLVAPDVPLVQHQRLLIQWNGHRTRQRMPRHTDAFNLLIGWANAGKNTPALPLEQAFFTGGANGIRGWRLRTLGPGNVSSLDANAISGVGDVRIDVQYEWRIALDGQLQLACFTDAGNVWLHGESASEESAWRWRNWNSWAWSGGLGLRYDLEFFLIRLDGGIRVHDPSQPVGERWVGTTRLRGAMHLGLGVPF